MNQHAPHEPFKSSLDQAMASLNPVLSDDLIEIAINPDCGLWVEKRGDSRMKRSDLELDPYTVEKLVNEIANEVGATFSDKKPVFSQSFHYRNWLIRAQALASPAVNENRALSLRFFNPDTRIYEPNWLFGKPVSASDERRKKNLELKKMAAEGDLMGALKFCVNEKRNLIVSGGTSSGKTMVARYLQQHIPHDERIITIEDAPDLLPEQPNKVMMVSLENDDYRSPDKLMQACLRMRPDRIILSEVRGKDGYTFLKAINTGHGGSITTLHADTAELAVSRLTQMALEAETGMTYSEMKDYIAQSIDVIVHTANIHGQRGVIEFFLPGDEKETPHV